MKKYFSYFKFLFIILGILAVVTAGAAVVSKLNSTYVRKNSEAPARRVYDYAEVLTEKEEDKLAELIARREKETGCDIVLVTINESLYKKYGVTEDTDKNWESCMMRFADDFYDENNFGYNRVHGDGVLLLHNWYPAEKGSWLSTCGRALDRYSRSMVNNILDDVYAKAKRNPYQAYRSYIENVYRDMSGKGKINLNPLILLVISVVAAGIFIATHIKSKEGEKTTAASTYVENNSVRFRIQRDELVNKFVTTRVIPRNTGGGGGGHSGGAGSHMSSGGVSHGGGGRRG